jgi:hypothetical protein
MRITGAMTLRDGGTTCVTVEENGVLVHVTVDHHLGLLTWLPRLRFIFTSTTQFGRDRRLFPGGAEERRYVSAIVQQATEHLDFAPVRDFLSGHCQNPARDLWFHVLNFLWIVERSRLPSVLESVRPSPDGRRFRDHFR